MNRNARFERRWTAGVFAAAVIAILTVPVAMIAQREGPPQERPAFEVATVKRAAPDAPIATLNRAVTYSPNRLNIPNMTLSALIYNAYGDGGFNTSMRVTGGPDWSNKTAFAIEGVAAPEPGLARHVPRPEPEVEDRGGRIVHRQPCSRGLRPPASRPASPRARPARAAAARAAPRRGR